MPKEPPAIGYESDPNGTILKCIILFGVVWFFGGLGLLIAAITQ